MINGKPVIGVSSSYMEKEEGDEVCIKQSYLEAVRHAGGIPMLIPVDGTDEELQLLVNQCDGMVLSGGVDVDPALYGEAVLNESVRISPKRDQGDLKICELTVGRKLPILGICRGMQILNVYFGGSLHQDIPAQLQTEVKHRMEPPYRRTSHRCLLESGSPLSVLLGTEEISVNSHHHQSVKDPAPGFCVMARCDDGVIEAIYDPKETFRWGIQWHPEKIWDIDENSIRIFEAFAEACKA